MLSASYGVSLLSNSAINCIYGCSTRTHAHPYTQTNTHTQTPQSMTTHQGFRVESWALTYRCYICRSLGLVAERPQCASLFARPRLLHATLRPHVYNGVQIQILLPAVASLDKE